MRAGRSPPARAATFPRPARALSCTIVGPGRVMPSLRGGGAGGSRQRGPGAEAGISVRHRAIRRGKRGPARGCGQAQAPCYAARRSSVGLARPTGAKSRIPGCARGRAHRSTVDSRGPAALPHSPSLPGHQEQRREREDEESARVGDSRDQHRRAQRRIPPELNIVIGISTPSTRQHEVQRHRKHHTRPGTSRRAARDEPHHAPHQAVDGLTGVISLRSCRACSRDLAQRDRADDHRDRLFASCRQSRRRSASAPRAPPVSIEPRGADHARGDERVTRLIAATPTGLERAHTDAKTSSSS